MFHNRCLGRLAGFGLTALFCSGAFAQPVIFSQPLSPRIANYDIDVKLDVEKKMLHGNEALKWFNKSGDAITELQFHLYLNAFRNHKSTFTFPVEIVVTFEGGEKVRETWDGRELWTKFTYTKPRKLVAATVDPDNKIPLDLNYTNNSKAVKGSSLGANKLSARWLFWMQFLLDQPEFMNVLSAPGSIF